MSSAIDAILSSIPIDQVAQQVGLSADDATPAITNALGAILAGMGANAADPKGAASLEKALSQHSGDLLDGGVSVDSLDTDDGGKIVKNIFGDNTDQVAAALGSTGTSGGTSVFQKLLPILAPVAMAWLAKNLFGGGSNSEAPAPAQAESSGGGLGDLLGSVLGGGASQQQSSGGGLSDLLGGLLGGGKR